MNSKDLKIIAEGLIATVESAGNKSIKIQNEGLKTTIKKMDLQLPMVIWKLIKFLQKKLVS